MGRLTMRKTPLLFVGSAIAASTLAMTTEAHALGPLSLEVGLNGGFATSPDSSAPFNGLGVGLGGRAGVSIFSFYGGLDAEYYLGGSADQPNPPPLTGTTHFSGHALKYGAQLGYNFGIPFVTIRPQLGLGNITVTACCSTSTIIVGGVSMTTTGPSVDTSSFYLEPGVVGLITFGMYFVGADANALVMTGFKDQNGNGTIKTSFTAHGQVGLTF
jgi:hypothetical protein